MCWKAWPQLLGLIWFGLIVPAASAEKIDYQRDIKPLLQARCIACHGPLKQAGGGLRLDTAAGIIKGGDHGNALKPGNAAASLLVQRVSATDEAERMPPEGEPLKPEQIALLKQWIAEGAVAPADEPVVDPRRHWAFQKPIRPAIPARNGESNNPIDAFLAGEQARLGLAPLPSAEQATLLRRVYLDLVGVPPSRQELQAFLSDERPDAYEQVVDRLLASPLHGQRWARHWMDIWRYSDWYGSRGGNELRNSRRHIWRWRDWLVESIAADKPYDRLIHEMLAADELAPGDRDIGRASGYLGRSYYVFNRHVWLQDTAEFTSTAFLGLTLKCCRCHDHKYDPLAQTEYFRMRAFFEPHNVRTDLLPGKSDVIQGNWPAGAPPGATLKDGCDVVYDSDLAAPTYLLERGNEKNPRTDQPLTPGVPAILGQPDLAIAPVALPVEAYYPDLRPERRQELIENARSAVVAAEAALTKAQAANQSAEVNVAQRQVESAKSSLAAIEARIAAELAKYAVVTADDAERQRLAREASKQERLAALSKAQHDLLLADQHREAAKSAAKPDDAKSQEALSAAEAKFKAATTAVETAQANAAKDDGAYTPLGPVYPATSTGRRLALARWITSRENPLAARVAVNHIWRRHFGTALVPSVANFGLNGKPPSHPALLDWLAVEFMENGWSQRQLHRLMVTSAAYRRATSAGAGSDQTAKNTQLDRDNRFLWRANLRRMESEVVRDSLWSLTGGLDCATGGPELEPSLADASPRRSLYFRITPDDQSVLLELFDGAAPAECFERTESIVPQQALALANGPIAASQARLVARELAKSAEQDAPFIQAAFEQILSRSPRSEELASCTKFIEQQATALANPAKLTRRSTGVNSVVAPATDPRQRARENLVLVLINHQDFVTIR